MHRAFPFRKNVDDAEARHACHYGVILQVQQAGERRAVL